MMTIKVVPFLLLLTAEAFAQHPDSSSPDCYPMKVGCQWTYKLGGSDGQQKIEVMSLISGDVYDVFVDFGPMSMEEKLEKGPDGVYLNSQRGGFLGPHWKDINPPEKMLQLPVQIGIKWKGEKDGDISSYRVVDRQDLSCAAGKFHNVFKVEIIDSYTEEATGNVKESMRRYQYFAPGVGLIKEETFKKGERPQPFLELTDYHIPD